MNRDDDSDESELSFTSSCSDCHDSGIELCDLLDTSGCNLPTIDGELKEDDDIASLQCGTNNVCFC